MTPEYDVVWSGSKHREWWPEPPRMPQERRSVIERWEEPAPRILASEAILEALRRDGPLTIPQLRERIPKPNAAIGSGLRRLWELGLVTKEWIPKRDRCFGMVRVRYRAVRPYRVYRVRG